MTGMEAERAFREMLPCEEKKTNIHTGGIRKLGAPSGIVIERGDSTLTKTFLVFPNGGNSIVKYQAELLRLSE